MTPFKAFVEASPVPSSWQEAEILVGLARLNGYSFNATLYSLNVVSSRANPGSPARWTSAEVRKMWLACKVEEVS